MSHYDIKRCIVKYHYLDLHDVIKCIEWICCSHCRARAGISDRVIMIRGLVSHRVGMPMIDVSQWVTMIRVLIVRVAISPISSNVITRPSVRDILTSTRKVLGVVIVRVTIRDVSHIVTMIRVRISHWVTMIRGLVSRRVIV